MSRHRKDRMGARRSAGRVSHPASKSAAGRPLRWEHLEDRRLLAVVTVDTVADVVDFTDGKTSLREAIFATNTVPGADEIRFDFGHDGPATILLTQGELSITDSLKISGPGAHLLTIDASGSDPTPGVNIGDGSRVFNIDDGDAQTHRDVAIQRLTLKGGDVYIANSDGGAIRSRENLYVADAIITENAAHHGGGISQDNSLATLVIHNTIIAHNAAAYGAGAWKYSNATVTNCVVAGNRADQNGGGILGYRLRVRDTTISSNFAAGSGGGMLGAGYLENVVITGNEAGRQGGGINASSLEINNSLVADNTTAGWGGGLRIWRRIIGTNLTVTNNNGGIGGCVSLDVWEGRSELTAAKITGNRARFDGGGIYQSDGLFTLSASIVRDNDAGRDGGGLYLSGRYADIVDTTIENNTAAGDGGGISGAGTDLGVVRSMVARNTANARGGGISSARLYVSGSSIRDNSASIGGGAYSSSQFYIDGSTVTGNSAARPGSVPSYGGGLATSGSTTIRNTTISGNTTTGRGGGAHFSRAATPREPVIENSTLSGNTAQDGGAIFGIRATIRNTTIFGNSTTQDGVECIGGVKLTDESSIEHSIAAGNRTGDGLDSDLSAPAKTRYTLIGFNAGTNFAEVPIGSPDANGNLIGGPIHGAIDPLLGPLADNGGPTFTHALLPGSPAIGAGDPAFRPGVIGAPEFDQRGAPYTRVAGARIDLGAFELQAEAGSLSGDFDLNGIVDGGDFLTWQRNVGTLAGATLRHGDATADGDVDTNDLAVWRARVASASAKVANRSPASHAAADNPQQRTPYEPVRRQSLAVERVDVRKDFAAAIDAALGED